MLWSEIRSAPPVLLVAVALALTSLLPGSVASANARPPNIILILADDLGYGELGSYGQKLIQTPALDRMAEEGMRFTQFYAGSTVCAPSRSVLMTGQHTGHTRVRGNARDNVAAQTLQPGDVTVAHVLQRAGYRTALIGKWGLGLVDQPGEPRRQGFDHYFGYLNQVHAHNHFPPFLWRDGEKVPLPNDLTPVGDKEGAGYATARLAYAGDLFAQAAREFISENQNRPFFLYLSVIVPHANNERTKALGDGNEVPDHAPYGDRPWADTHKAHAAMITRLDAQIGELLADVKRLGLDERTLVIFTSDNGPHQEGGREYDPAFFNVSGPLRGLKRTLTEGGIRVPLIARWPGRIQPNSVSRHVGYFGDVMATVADIADVHPPRNLDSISFVPTLLGRRRQREHDYLYWEYYEGGFSQAVLLAGRWKGIRLVDPTAPIQLFDLTNDLGESRDIASKRPKTASQIANLMRAAHVDNEHWRMP